MLYKNIILLSQNILNAEVTQIIPSSIVLIIERWFYMQKHKSLLHLYILVPVIFCCRKTSQLSVSGQDSMWKSTEPRACPKWTPALWQMLKKLSLEIIRTWLIRMSRCYLQGKRWAEFLLMINWYVLIVCRTGVIKLGPGGPVSCRV